VYGGVSINPQMMKLRAIDAGGHPRPPARPVPPERAEVQPAANPGAGRSRPHARPGLSEELANIYRMLPKKRQTLLFSATFSDEIRLLAGQMLNDPLSIEVSPRNVAANTVKQWVVPVDKKRKAELFVHLMRKGKLEAGAGVRQDP
jgi:hypothetical protein